MTDGNSLTIESILTHLPAPDGSPGTYDAARRAIKVSKRSPMAKAWLDWTAGVQAIARVSGTDEARADAQRLHAIAYRRAGRLLKQYAGAFRARHRDPEVARQTGLELGFSQRMIDLAMRIAEIHSVQFDGLMRRDVPPSLLALAELGDRARREVAAANRQAAQDTGIEDQAARNAGQALLSLAHLSACTDPTSMAQAIASAEKPTRALYQSALAFARETLGRLAESSPDRSKAVAR